MSNKPQASRAVGQQARPEDLPTPDGLDLQPAVHLAMDLEALDAVARRPVPATDLPLADVEDETEDLEQDDLDPGEASFVLLDRAGQPVPGVSATPLDEEIRDADPSRGEAALRDWRLRAPGRKAEALELERQQSLVRTLQGSAALMALLLVTTLVAVRWWRGHQSTTRLVEPVASTALLSPSPVAPPPQAVPEPTVKEAAPAAPAARPDPLPPVAQPPSAEALSAVGTQGLIEGTLRHWTGPDGYLYWQWDYTGTEPLDLQWRDAAGEVRMQDRVCDGRIDATTGRCYVGRSAARFQSELDRGAAPGAWTLESCLAGDCAVVNTFELSSPE